jgi:preprotein translocase subunit Sec61beta
MNFGKSKPVHSPSSALGLVSFSESSKSLVRLTPEIVMISAIVFGLIVLFLKIFL